MAGNNIVKVQIKADADTREIDQVVAQLNALRDKRLKVKVDVDDADLNRLKQISNARVKVEVNDSALDALKTRLRAMRNERVVVNVDVRERNNFADRASRAVNNRTARINVNLVGVEAAEARLDRLARNRTIRMNIDVDGAALVAIVAALERLSDLGDLGARLGRIGDGVGGVARSGGALAGAAPAIIALAPAIGVLASGAIGTGVYGLAGALGAVSLAAGGLGSAVTIGIGAIPIAAAAASQEVKDHFKFMANDVVTTMKEIAVPLQQPLINLATSVGAAFHQMRPNLEAITAGTAELVNHLSGKLPQIAAELGPALQRAFEAGVPHVKNLINIMPELIRGFGDLMSSIGQPEVVEAFNRALEALPGILTKAGEGIETLAGGFNNIMGFLDSGKMDGFTEGIGTFFDNLGNTDWSGLADSVAEAGNAFGDFMANIDTDNLASNLTGLADGITELTNAASGIVGAFQGADNALADFSEKVNNIDVQLVSDDWANDLNSVLDHFGLIDWDGPEIQANPNVNVTPIDMTAEDFVGVISPLVTGVDMPLTPVINGEVPPVPASPLDLIPGLAGEVPQPAPIEQPITPGPMPTPEAPGAVPVDVEVKGAVTVPPPPPVPISFDVTQPTLVLNPPPPVPITFNVDLPTIEIPVPPEVPVTVISNVDEVAGQINGLSALNTETKHTITTNASEAASQIQSLNGMNTSSTHTVHIVQSGSMPGGESVPR